MQSSAKVVCIPPVLTGVLWPVVGAHITKAHFVKAGDIKEAVTGMAAVAHAIVDGEAQLWAVMDGDDILASWTTALERDGDDLVLVIRGLSGSDMERWGEDITAAMVKFARDEGCTSSRVDNGRAH